VHCGNSVQDVLDHTGFALNVPEGVGQTPPPSEDELELLRNKIDPTGELRH